MITFSNAQPIQFWTEDELTYNQKEVCGITPACFCQPFNFDDVITIQFDDSEADSSPAPTYKLAIISELTGLVVNTPPSFVQSLGGTRFQLTAVLETGFGTTLSAGKYRMVIYNGTNGQSLLAPSSWSDISAPTTFDSKTATQFVETGFAPASASRTAYQAFVVENVGSPQVVMNYTVTITNYTLTGSNPRVQVSFFLDDDPVAGGVVGGADTDDYQHTFTANGVYTIEAILEFNTPASSDAAYIRLNVDILGASGGSVDVAVTITPGLIYVPVALKSDCLDIKDSHDCSNLITYSNAANFAGIDYDTSPSPEFNLRVPSVFFHEEHTEEEKTHPLSDDTFIQTWARLTKKRRLEIGYVPYYFHEKMKLVLMHQFIEIDGEDWVKRDPYEVTDGNKRYPLKTASVMLTDKNFIKRNLL